MSVHCIISGGEYAAELSKDKKRAVRQKASMLVVQKRKCFNTTWQSCEGLGLNYDEYYEKVIACMLSKSSIHNWH